MRRDDEHPGVRSINVKTQALRIYAFALGLAFRMLASGRVLEGLKMLISPVGYWRFIPNALTYREFRRLTNPRVLDVSSPKLVSLFLATRTSADVEATDLDDEKIVTRWKTAADVLGLANYRVAYQDARRLLYPDESFDLVYSISVIEHIPDDGDALSLREFRRVLKPGGSLVVQVPYRRQRNDISISIDSKGTPLPGPRFYERHYDMARLKERLEIEGLQLTDKIIMGEWLNLDPLLSATSGLHRLLRIAIRPFEPLLALVNYWTRPDDASGYPLGALLVYKKP
jgi:SAM-dependent methyltransferase